MERYDPAAVEARWQEIWQRERVFETANPSPGDDTSRLVYVLEMLPYPSGELHMGHVKNYTMGDVVTLFRRRHGDRVMHPMGYDAFGLHAENAAIKTGRHPAESDRARTSPPSAARCSGWAGRSTGRASSRRPSPSTTTGRSGSSCGCSRRAWPTASRRRQVVPDRPDRAGQRAGHRRPLRALRQRGRGATLEQWFFKITDYADRLLDDLARRSTGRSAW